MTDKDNLIEALEKALMKAVEDPNLFFCRKYQHWTNRKFLREHHCFRARRIYVNGKGERVAIMCKNLATLQRQLFYEQYRSLIYETLEECYIKATQVRPKPLPIEKREPLENLERIKIAGRKLLKEGIYDGD